MAGRVSGYAQAVLGIGGLIFTVLFGLRFISWYLANWSHFRDPQADPVALLGDLWVGVRWALLGIGIFVLGWLWALATSLQILRSAKQAEQANVPPRLG
jgi:hypothetical protein